MKRIALGLLAIGVIIGGATVLWNKNQAATQVITPEVKIYPEPNNSNLEEITQESVQHSLSLTAQYDGQTAFELLEQSATIEYELYDFGVMITSINGTKSDQQHYWALYVNDEYAIAGADQTTLTAGDVTTWKYERLNATPF